MAVDVDALLTPLVPAAVRADLAALATLIGLTISTRPTDPTFQLCDWLAKWFCTYWNTYAIPALRGQFGATAAGEWMTAWAMSKGVARPLATFASGPVTIENRSGVFVDASAPGAVSITTPGGFTFVSTGPAPGSTGTMGAAVGSAYPQTTLLLSCSQTGSAANTASGALPTYPTALASGPAGVYVVSNGALLGSDAMSDAQLYQLVLASLAQTSSPGGPLAKYVATALRATLPGGIPVATSRVRVYGAGAVVHVACATPGGPTPGNVTTPGTELYVINAAVQLACAQPGLTIEVEGAGQTTIALGAVVIYVDPASGVTAAQAVATATAAFDLWQSLLPVGGEAIVSAGQGYALFNAIAAALQSQVNPAYPAQWLTATYYDAGEQVSNQGQTFVATSPGTSAGLVGPLGAGGADGGTGLTWAPTSSLGGGALFQAAPGVIDVSIAGITGDVALAINAVAIFTHSISAQLVPQH